MSAMHKPKSGGVALVSIFDMNRAASIKWLWNCCTSDSVWATWMKIHYFKELSIWEDDVHPMDTYMWKDMAHVRQIALLHMHEDDSGQWLWAASSNGQFLFVSAWNIVRSLSPPSIHYFGFPCHSPKMKCCLLRALNDRLFTASRLKQFSIIDQDLCVHCYKECETVEHLFFFCPYSAHIWSLCKLKLWMDAPIKSLQMKLWILRRNFQRRINVMS